MARWLAGIIVVVVVVVGVAWAFGFINLDQTRDARLPKVAVEGGQMPKFDADVADVDVGTRKEPIEVPRVEVGTERTQVDVPTVDVKKPADK
jgi:hypothetical protein